MKNYEEDTRELYNNIESIWDDTNIWYRYTHTQISSFMQRHKSIYSHSKKTINAGAGNTIYDLPGELYNVDLAENLVSKLPNYFVASIEQMPFKDSMFDTAVCVGSVLNYCDALSALTEIDRVLLKGGVLILEYERSLTGELIFKSGYGKSIVLQKYDYNGQSNHNLWLYSDTYINNILSNLGLEIIVDDFFHSISAIYNNIFKNEQKAGNYAKFDNYIPKIISKRCAHNRILICRKM